MMRLNIPAFSAEDSGWVYLVCKVWSLRSAVGEQCAKTEAAGAIKAGKTTACPSRADRPKEKIKPAEYSFVYSIGICLDYVLIFFNYQMFSLLYYQLHHQKLVGREFKHYTNPKTPTPHNQPMKGR